MKTCVHKYPQSDCLDCIRIQILVHDPVVKGLVKTLQNFLRDDSNVRISVTDRIATTDWLRVYEEAIKEVK
jgi:hypothetical protein